MILAFSDDGVLTLHADIQGVAMHCESIDVDSGRYVFYDDQGRALRPVFDIPVETKSFFWFFETVSGGQYHLELDTSGDAEHILFSFLECNHLAPSQGHESLDEVKSFLREQGVMVDAPDSS